MPTWNEFLQEALRRRGPQAPTGDFDTVRREQLRRLSEYTGRNLIIYVVDFLDPGRSKAPGALSIELSDKLGFIEVLRRLEGPAVDILIESPGGSPEATEALVTLLRQKFNDVRFIVPNVAKSAATMMAMSGNMLILDEPSELGPIDPQFIFHREGNPVVSPAHAILDQFDWATNDIKDNPNHLPVWMPILNQYGPSLLVECHAAIALAERLVAGWLERYMFGGEPDCRKKGRRIAGFLSAYKEHLSHRRAIGMGQLQQYGVKILNMNTDPQLKERIWDVYNSIFATFVGTPAFKLFENHLGDCYVSMAAQVQIGIGFPQLMRQPIPAPIAPIPAPPAPTPQPGN